MTFFRAVTIFSIFPWSFTSRNAVFGPIPGIERDRIKLWKVLQIEENG